MKFVQRSQSQLALAMHMTRIIVTLPCHGGGGGGGCWTSPTDLPTSDEVLFEKWGKFEKFLLNAWAHGDCPHEYLQACRAAMPLKPWHDTF